VLPPDEEPGVVAETGALLPLLLLLSISRVVLCLPGDP